MARITIVILIPIVALLVWRDWVIEREIRLLAVYDTAHHDRLGEEQLEMRDGRIDDAMWSLLLGDPKAAADAIYEVTRMPAPTAVPMRAWRIASAANCALGGFQVERYGDAASDPRVRQYCKGKK
jgi:hypothetical protein